MKMLALVLGFVVVAVFVVEACFFPVHDWLAVRNTRYSPNFSDGNFAAISVGTHRSIVLNLLGAPLDTHSLTNYPVWAMRDEGVRRKYGTNSELQIVSLIFSQPKRSGDFDLVFVWIGPDTNVVEISRGITD